MKSSLGVDLGATWLRACLRADRRPPRTIKRSAVDWQRLPRVLRRLLAQSRLRRIGTITVGGTRLGDGRNRSNLRRALASLARRVNVLPDFEIAHMAAFGRGPGVVLAAGTGSVAFARGLDGKTKRAGGLGPLLGDEGSGFWLGREALRDPLLSRRLPPALALAHAPDPVRATAALARRVLRNSPRLRREAAGHLCLLARRAAQGLTLPEPRPLLLHGGLFKNTTLRELVQRRLGSGWTIVEPRIRAEEAAAGLGPRA